MPRYMLAIELFDGKRWSTVGASPNIIEASWLALVDAIEYGLTIAPTARETPTARARTNA